MLLETALPDRENRLSYLFLEPREVLQTHDPRRVCELLERAGRAIGGGLWVAGALSYEAGYALEPALEDLARPSKFSPLVWLGLYERPYVFDHRLDRWSADLPKRAVKTTEDYSWRVDHPSLERSREEFSRDILQIKELIRRGETYQVNYTTRRRFEFSGSPLGLYRALRARQRVPYAGLLRCGDWWVLSLSPELFFRLEPSGKLVTRPMKGTAARGRSAAEDARLKNKLRRDEKNRAENLMIVDLLRNDLGKLCRTGTVSVPRLFSVERYETLFQMTSTVEGRVPPARSGLTGLLTALFPSGSVTGAPKIRTMRLIAGLEGSPRGIYTGALGFAAPDGGAVFNVAIRTLEIDGNRGVLGVGGGIVADSQPAAEYEECRLKGLFLSGLSNGPADKEFELVETLLRREGTFPLLEYHLDRMGGSARYFGIPFDRRRARRFILAEAGKFPGSGPQRVRLLLDRRGSLRAECAGFEPLAGKARIAFYGESTDQADRFYYHKTTFRPLYSKAFAEARARGLFDYIFTNRRGEVTEGTICNVYAQFGDILYTPPVRSGLLAGVYRKYLRNVGKPFVREKNLRREDLEKADSLWVSNALQGLLEAELVEEEP